MTDGHQLLRARFFLATRYGVDSSDLSEAVVVGRVSALLGVVSSSVAASLSAIDLRLDTAGFSREDEDLTDEELQWLEEQDIDLPWDDDRADDWSEGDHPRDEGGRFAEAGGGQQTARSWLRGFDDRDHQRQMDEHRRTETFHRAQSLKIRGQMSALRERGKAATTPRQKATIKRQFDRLSAQREEHRSAATSAKASRAEVSRDLTRSRSLHATLASASSASRRQAAAARAEAERGSFMAIGRGRIGASVGGHPEVEDAGHHVQSTWNPTEADTHEALRDAERERSERSASLAKAEEDRRIAAAPRQAASTDWRPGDETRTRQVVSYATTGESPEDRSVRLVRQQRESDKRASLRARQERWRAELQAPANPPPMTEKTPSVVSKAKVFLRSLLAKRPTQVAV